MYTFSKRLLDIAISLTALLCLLPLFAVIALAILVTDGRPIFYAQTRVGRFGRRFRFYKFRTMVRNADALLKDLACKNEAGGVIFKMRSDPRITWVGRWLRRFSIDEMPQLLHVLSGEMTLVGPRPPKVEEVAEYRVNDMARLTVAQGLTCLWQVSGRSELPFDRQVELDVEYVRKRGIWMDLTILARTIPAVLGGRGAY
jgi:lipopolysaccharide/colanic/teichoic acid biosynthesis glycosyltransferase